MPLPDPPVPDALPPVAEPCVEPPLADADPVVEIEPLPVADPVVELAPAPDPVAEVVLEVARPEVLASQATDEAAGSGAALSVAILDRRTHELFSNGNAQIPGIATLRQIRFEWASPFWTS